MYKFKNNDMRIPTYVWSEKESIEETAIEQIKNAGNLPFAFHHTVLCPDAHQGYGVPIGGIIACDKVVIPNAVGVDIGCGMCAIKTSLTKIDTETLKKIMGEMRNAIPVGFNHHKEMQDFELMPGTNGESLMDCYPIVYREYDSALKQLGTLGGGNHFIEIQKGNDGYVWIMIHSGSRNLGYKVAKHYNEVAKKLNEKWFVSTPKQLDLAFLPIETKEGKSYMKEMQYCVDFAYANRKLMMDNVTAMFYKNFQDVEFDEMINIAHNYAAWENHFNKNVIVHRKGTTLARKGTIGIIPGSQGTKSYIAEGLGNKDSFESCSHGAGRTMGRKQACRTLNLKEEIAKLDEQGIVHGIRHQNDLDEASGAYKDINVVMKNQSDLVDILVELTPLGVIKG
jgi:tRNA-splicing ligase RtcB (3'-phosphate/5'-hydroxy nucleic acid ligase)